MYAKFQQHLADGLQQIREAGTYKSERVIQSPQGTNVRVAAQQKGSGVGVGKPPALGQSALATPTPDPLGTPVLNFCANNYLGLAQASRSAPAAHEAMDRWGYGLASVRFICGTQQPHKELERRLSDFLGTDDTILYSSCFDANGGLFETLLGQDDAIISDELNHASIIDGIRLCKAQRLRYRNRDMADLEARLQEARRARFRMIATDGVFSMDGYIAPLAEICELADRYDALVMVDDSHAVGFMGPRGRGTHEHCGVMGRVDILTGTLGKALGGASGGYTSGRREIVEYLRQRSRPYLFSNTVAPAIVGGSLAVLDLLTHSTALRDRLHENTRYFRAGLEKLGLSVLPGEHPIVPVMLGDAALAARFADAMLERGVYVIGFSLSRGAAGQGPHSHASQRGPRARGSGPGAGGVRGGEAGVGRVAESRVYGNSTRIDRWRVARGRGVGHFYGRESRDGRAVGGQVSRERLGRLRRRAGVRRRRRGRAVPNAAGAPRPVP